MLAPALLFYALSFAVPLLVVGRLSLFEADYVRETFVGLRNYAMAFADPYFQKSFVNAFVFVAMVSPTMITISYWTASLLSGFRSRVQAIGRFLLYVPSLASGLIMTLVWRWMLQKAGLLNGLLDLVGIPAIPWLSEAWAARLAVALISIVSGIGGTVIVFAAYMHSIPTELKDVATVDGASDRQYKRQIVLPLMTPAILLVLMLNVVGLMQVWEILYVLFQRGGPEGSTASPVYEIFLTAFQFGRQGYAAAKGVVLMLVIAAMVVVKQRVEKWVR